MNESEDTYDNTQLPTHGRIIEIHNEQKGNKMDWKKIVYKALLGALHMLVDAGVVQDVKDIVVIYMDQDMSGDQKKLMVYKEIAEMKTHAADAVRGTSRILIDLIISIVLVTESK